MAYRPVPHLVQEKEEQDETYWSSRAGFHRCLHRSGATGKERSTGGRLIWLGIDRGAQYFHGLFRRHSLSTEHKMIRWVRLTLHWPDNVAERGLVRFKHITAPGAHFSARGISCACSLRVFSAALGPVT